MAQKAGLWQKLTRKGSNQQNWIYRRMLRVSWTEYRTEESIITELNTTRQLLGFVVRRKLSFFGHTIRDWGCELVKCVIQCKVSGKQWRGWPKTSYRSNITKCMSESMEQITRETRDRDGWRRLVRCAVRAADHHSWWDRERRRKIMSFIEWNSKLFRGMTIFQACKGSNSPAGTNVHLNNVLASTDNRPDIQTIRERLFCKMIFEPPSW